MFDYVLYDEMKKLYKDVGSRVVVDSAFKVGNNDYVIKYFQRAPPDCHVILLNEATISICQLSEWDMHVIGGSFPRLRDSPHFEEDGKMKFILRLIVHLYNFQTSKIRINQIRNSFCEKTGYFGHARIDADENSIMC